MKTVREVLKVAIGEKVTKAELNQIGAAKWYTIAGIEYCDLPLTSFKQTSPGIFERIE